MAAVTPINNLGKPRAGGSMIMNVMKIAIIALLVGGSIWLLMAHSEWFRDPKLVKVQVRQWGVWGPVVFMVLYAVGPSFLVPGAVMTIAGGLAFGTVWGSAYSLIGGDAGALIAFAAGRFLGKSFVEQIVGQRVQSTLHKNAKHGFQIIFYFRMVPVIPYNALNLLAGAPPLPFPHPLLATQIREGAGTNPLL